MADQLQTTLGTVSMDELGRTLIHEHAITGFPGWELDAKAPRFVRAEAMARAVDSLQALKDYGVKTFVDPCPMDLGRDVEFLAELSQKSGLHVVCATGVYYEKAGITYTFARMPLEEIVDIYVQEIEQGVNETGIKAGIIKIATGKGEVSRYETKMLQAAARASKATGVPILSHTEEATCGQDQIDIVTGEGLAPHHLMVGHSCGRDDHDYQLGLAKRGAYVGFDRFGIDVFVSDEIRVKNVAKLVAAGHRDQIMLSHDTVDCFLGRAPGVGSTEELRARMPNWRLTHIFENIVPQLRDQGVSQSDIDIILAENPKRFFAGDPLPTA